MEEFWGLWALLAVAAVLCGPVALAVSLTALKRIREIQSELEMMIEAAPPAERRAGDRPRLTPIFPAPPAVGPAAPAAPPTIPAESPGGHPPSPGPEVRPMVPNVARPRRESLALEQRIGTRWALVAGVITIVFAVGFFLNYAYESGWIGPLGRVLIAAAGGLLALAIGELTRRRGYDFVAKGVTALGFAILYATVFAAHRWYGLLGSAPAYGLATAITTAAMFYAVVLDEVIVAVLSLVGGYITPVVLSTGENLPTLLFSYVLILSAGAVLCAYSRKWSAVNIVAFFGTYLLYMGWWERFYRPALDRGVTPQLGVALFWLCVFFFVYLLVPLLHTLVRRVRAQRRTWCSCWPTAASFCTSWLAMLMDEHQNGLALCSLLMGVAYLSLTVLAFLRCPDDANLRITLLLAGLSFASLAVPLYFEANAIAVIWAIEAVALAAVGLRYRNLLIQAAAGLLAALTVGDLLYHLPLHTQSFRPVLNAAFGTWSFVAAALLAGHVLYRLDKHLDPAIRQAVTQILYAAGLLLLMAAIGLELWYVPNHEADAFFSRQMILVFAVFLLLFVARPAAAARTPVPAGHHQYRRDRVHLPPPRASAVPQATLSAFSERGFCPGPGSGGRVVHCGLAGSTRWPEAAGGATRRTGPGAVRHPGAVARDDAGDLGPLSSRPRRQLAAVGAHVYLGVVGGVCVGSDGHWLAVAPPIGALPRAGHLRAAAGEDLPRGHPDAGCDVPDRRLPGDRPGADRRLLPVPVPQEDGLLRARPAERGRRPGPARGERRVRWTSCSRHWSGPSFAAGFD